MANKEDLDLEDGMSPRTSMRNCILLIAVQMGYILLAFYPVLASLAWTSEKLSAAGWIGILAKGCAAYTVMHVLLVGPIAQFAKRDLDKISSSMLRLTVLTLLLALPLFSFGFYWGTFRSWMDIHELLITVLPACIVGSFLFDMEKNAWRLSFVLTVPIFISFFVVNDLLGPFLVPLSYAVHHPLFLMLKTFMAAFAIVLAGFLTHNKDTNLKADALMAVALLMVILFGIQEGLKSQIDPKGLFALLPLDRSWLFFLVIGIFARIRIKLFVQSAWVAGLGLCSVTLYRLIQFFKEGDVSLLQLSWFFTSLLGVAALLSFAITGIKSLRLNS